ncbi:hypothetical protein, variant 1 [Aphanomyces invadans]|uniref:Uncharacterized protein n=1 Tax=Aphanomyces invadans TaxID=157072 RepID=A0A024TH13_9STRA|nr:hypothetical protein, variant 1 [Aphanomyces invadans]ETV92866.1 hypothetical protein, variant 1 [Aphanomyces invadans]|eukprot:XP_008878387.1 hypothetical protein, variant 1 [Aphanomyces invadans]
MGTTTSFTMKATSNDNAAAASIRFFRTKCSHADLFRESYIRCYQNHGLKVIRCFPHCCPHMEYRGCGASLSLHVDHSGRADANRLQAFGRFQVASEPFFAPNDIIPLATFTSDLRSQRNALGTWLRGERHAPERGGGEVPTAAVFHFNEKRTDGWHYTWQGGSSTKKREELHQFRVYVVSRDSDSNDCAVVWSAGTPPFKLSSYRRARQNDEPVIAPQSKTRMTRASSHAQPHAPLVVDATPSRIQQHAHYLRTLHDFCTSISIDDIARPDWLAFEQRLLCQSRRWIQSAAAANIPFATSLLHPDHLRVSRSIEWGTQHELALDLMWQWFTPALFHRLHAFAADHAVEANDEVPQVYYEWIGTLYAIVEDMLAAHSETVERLAHRLDQRNRAAFDGDDDKIGLHAVLCTLQECAKLKAAARSDDAPANCRYQGLWVLANVQLRRMDLRPSLATFFRVFTMLFAVHSRLDGDVFFVITTSILLDTVLALMFACQGQLTRPDVARDEDRIPLERPAPPV